MPNGGSDCCGTCWYNARNKGEAGYGHAQDPEPAHCRIRDLAIENPFYTYCGNHPHRRPEGDPIPIGPVYVGEERALWQHSPDTEEIRRHLLDLLEGMKEQPDEEYPIGAQGDELVVWQLGEFREERAVASLRRITSFDPKAGGSGPFGRSRKELVRLARKALSKIEGRSR